ncbi:tRNA lysidine(34) synthetase TilS [Neosynechococcus sphagnicola]|uniref:tRNA lysidine(34) synthetase TilS n=1 Tax=Neosynechococcus sphagnicola TaxID=1501145 RepID=UPI0006893B89|nr:tRNA lysidine(34) synthetase TilS [Neosynechococcus sphagnicola]
MTRSDFWTPLHVRLDHTLQQRQLLLPHQRLLVAVSGGQDSLCLIQLLRDLQPKWHWQLAIAHCDHRWRSDSLANAEYVETLAEGWQLPCHRSTASQRATSEAGARTWRYDCLQAIAQAEGYTAIVTGHTASDRAETLLYNLMRGSGLDGLQALSWQRSLGTGLTLVRPLLGFTRQETEGCCRHAQLKIWEDATNQDLTYARNRIRQKLLPYLHTHCNPQVERHLAQTAELLQADTHYLETQADNLRQQVQHPSQPKLYRPPLQVAPLALQRRVLRQFLQQWLPTAPNFEQVEKFQQLIAAPNRTRTDPFPGEAIAQVTGNWIWLLPAPRPKSPQEVTNSG